MPPLDASLSVGLHRHGNGKAVPRPDASFCVLAALGTKYIPLNHLLYAKIEAPSRGTRNRRLTVRAVEGAASANTRRPAGRSTAAASRRRLSPLR